MSSAPTQTPSSVPSAMQRQFALLQGHFQSGQTRPLKARREALDRLEHLIRENRDGICEALFKDLHKPRQEALISEIAVTLEEIQIAKKNLKRWMRPERRRAPWTLMPARAEVFFEPLGVVLIIGPWNYPFQLMLSPLLGALAAGNCALLKPSELAGSTAQLLQDLIPKYLPPDLVRVVTGGIPETTELLRLKWNHIFFTGSTAVGQIVMQAAAQNLVPVTLELGGKSPVIVCEDADLELAARRIVWGKFYNAGQTCVAPDYLYVQENVAASLLEKIKNEIHRQYGETPHLSPDLGRIINSKNTERLARLMDSDKVIFGGQIDRTNHAIGPTLLSGVTWSDPIMKEEIFGPLLPILTYRSLQEVFQILKTLPKPLAAYFFSKSRERRAAFIDELSFGGGCINDVVIQVGNPHLPFGGVGDSGMGSYHGEESFKTFSHRKSVMTRSGLFDLAARYAPYSAKKLRILRRFFDI